MDLESEIDIYYDCDMCDQTFSSGPDLEAHKLEVHMRLYKCPYCEQGYKELGILESHIKHKHTRQKKPQVLNQEISKRKVKEEENSSKNSTQHVCCNCNKKFNTLNGLNRHISFSHGAKHTYNCPDCSQSYRSEKLLEKHIDKEHLKIGKEVQQYKCDDCGKTLQTGSLFHVCKNEVPLTCEHCGENFVNSDEFKTHKRSFHQPTKYPCTVCEKVFHDQLKLVYHLQIQHWECPEMQMDSPVKIQLDSPACNVKKHKCDFCETAFARPENLKRHVRRMHKAKVIS